jgi:hypothetical protein
MLPLLKKISDLIVRAKAIESDSLDHAGLGLAGPC